ncbi:GAF domain-containing protein [Candidatus Poribacteria bacterium]|nr:GAF domain-containing protein [Candidatus Poribacteria bacterium]MYH80997.1 GAF domain-containing protein [Candidatus Poribacteria bacterium]
MLTFFLALFVVLINISTHLFQMQAYYPAASHCYYGVMILAVIYARPREQNILFGLTAVANWVYVFRYPTQTGSIIIALLYPFLVFGVIRIIRQFQTQRRSRVEEMEEIHSVNANLEKQIRDISTLFEVSQAANANLELQGLFQRIIEILSKRLGIYRGALHLYENGKVVTSVETVLGLTPAEMKRGTDDQMEDIQKQVLTSGKAIGVPQTRNPRSYIKFFEPERVESKDAIAFWCIPIIVEEHVIGTLTIDKASDEFSAEDDRRLLTIIASTIAQRVKIQQTIDALVESERMATLGRLVRTIAHEVRNPLGSIRLGTQLLQHTETEADSEVGTSSDKVQLSQDEIQEYTAIIIKEVDRLNRFIEQLLAFSKPAMQLAKRTDIHQLLESSLAICRPELEHHAITVATQYDNNCPQVNINEDGITQVLLNLFYNAIEAMDTGGTLTIQTEYPPEKEIIHVRVQNDGPSIPPEDIPMLFDPFYTTKQKGTGLGLYISQKILAEHQGRIEVDPNLEVGTAFVVSLPVH